MIQTPGMGVKRNFAALNVANEARAQMGEAVAQVGQAVGEFSQKLQAAKNYGIAADASRQMQQAWGDFVQSREGRDDEDNWVGEWKEKAQSLKSSVYEQHAVGPALKRQLEQNFKDWEQTNAIETSTIANKKAIRTANLRVDEAINEAAKTGQPEAADSQIRELINGKVKAGLIAPQLGKAELQAALNKVDEYGARNYIASNPAGAVDYLKDNKNFSRLDPDQRFRLMTAARERMHQYQSDNAMEIMTTAPTDDELSMQVKSGIISERGAKQIRIYRDKANYDSARANAGEIGGDIADYAPDYDKDQQQFNELKVRIKALPDFMDRYKNSLMNRLTKKTKEGAGGDDGYKVINDMYQQKLFGDWMTFDEKAKKNVHDPAGWKKANDTRWAIQDELEQWRQEHPTASRSEERDQVFKISQKHFDGKATQAVFDGLTQETK